MKYPPSKFYIRFYKYGGIWKLVIVRDPARETYLTIYTDNVRFGLTAENYKKISSYHVYGYDDWAQCDGPPDYISKFQQFEWYKLYWEKYK